MPRTAFDHTGLRYGKLLVLKRVNKISPPKWLCTCDCGNTHIVNSSELTGNKTKSCGCIMLSRKESYSRLYSIRKGMIQRCTNKKSTGYKNYGGRGITVCKEWLTSFSKFKKWATANGYSKLLTIDRIENNKGYYPSNCRWATKAIQTRNTRLKNNNKSGYQNVHFSTSMNKYTAQIKLKGKSIILGYADTAKEMAKIRDTFIIKNNLIGYTLNNF